MDRIEIEKMYRVALWQIKGVGYVTFHRLLKYFESAEVAWSEVDTWKQVLGDTLQTVKLIEKKARVEPERLWEQLARLEVKVACFGLDDDYPANLASVERPPPTLFVRGNFQATDEQAVAIVGTRKPTTYGVQVTASITKELVKHGLTIVSGLARGIDGVAHRTAIETGGRTIAVLGGGIDRIYPRENEQLSKLIMEHGAVVSTFPVGEAGLPGNFVIRNRFVAGLSLGVLVTEGASKSGTRITAEYAIEQQKPVFAVPGDITRPMSQGPVELLKKRAVLVTSGEDILDYLNIRLRSSTQHRVNAIQLSETQRMIFEYMKEGITDVDQLAQISMMPVPALTVELTFLEMERLIERTDRGFVVVDR